MAAETKPAWGKTSTEAQVVDPTPAPAPKAPEVRPIDTDRAQLVAFALVLLAAGLAMFHPGLALIAPAVYLLVLSYPRRR